MDDSSPRLFGFLFRPFFGLAWGFSTTPGRFAASGRVFGSISRRDLPAVQAHEGRGVGPLPAVRAERVDGFSEGVEGGGGVRWGGWGG